MERQHRFFRHGTIMSIITLMTGNPFNRKGKRVMKIHGMIILFFTVMLIISGACSKREYPNEVPEEDRSPDRYFDNKSDGIRYYSGLTAHGDYSMLKLIIRTEKTDYLPGEDVRIKFYVRNDSDGVVHIRYLGSAILWAAQFWKLFHSHGGEAVKTPKWEEKIQRYCEESKYSWSGIGNAEWHEYIKLQPGQEFAFNWCSLGDYYELSEPDIYELTCFITSFIREQEYETPLQSNTLTFRILEPTDEEPSQRRQVVQDVPFTNPPPGEEVFKQTKPPKNVFYMQTNTEYFILNSGESPYEYRRQKAKEAEAKQ